MPTPIPPPPPALFPTLQEEYNTCLFHAATALGRSLTALAEEQFGPLELTPTMAFILMTTRTAPGILSTDLARVHQLDVSTISRAVDKLVHERFVQREGTRKNIRIFITPLGEKKEADARAAWAKLRQAYGLVLTDPGARDLADHIARSDGRLREARPRKRRTANGKNIAVPGTGA
ncbi:MAG TPA: MarR family transcriptional regulator [Flavobacteriales bacterium]|nr:MarR family transcriptional regulator [Flavobacteriales bacterium]HMW96331.1 MarR family transcriptional regulator [Flavobacteriales bacterium]HNI04629.1 MarR family transcriptional regulator [Flavobacteriales bacterium]HNM68964.1 MarR family transcriptional regulator [Flavobacteriales bacterium]HNO04604.1 MarR family transcriptional regulator [Flavobacteriales bacterium]